MTNVIFVMGVLIPILVLIIFVCLSSLRKQSVRIRELELEREEQQKNLVYLYNHAEEIANIKTARRHFENEIQEAKSDEEIIDIINAVISTNNVRMRDN